MDAQEINLVINHKNEALSRLRQALGFHPIINPSPTDQRDALRIAWQFKDFMSSLSKLSFRFPISAKDEQNQFEFLIGTPIGKKINPLQPFGILVAQRPDQLSVKLGLNIFIPQDKSTDLVKAVREDPIFLVDFAQDAEADFYNPIFSKPSLDHHVHLPESLRSKIDFSQNHGFHSRVFLEKRFTNTKHQTSSDNVSINPSNFFFLSLHRSNRLFTEGALQI